MVIGSPSRIAAGVVLARHKKNKNKNINEHAVNTSKAFSKATTRISKEEDFIGGKDVNGYIRGFNTVASKIPFQIFDIIDNLVTMDPYVNKYHHSTVALANSPHDIIIDAPSLATAQKALDAANELAETCFPYGGGMGGLLSGCFSQLARTTATCVEWVAAKDLSGISKGYLIPIKSIRFTYDKNGDYILCQQQGLDLVTLNPNQTIYYNAMIRDGNPYATPAIVSAIEPCANHKAIVDKIALWMDKVSALGVMTAEVEPPPRLPGESQDDYNTKAKTYLDELASSISNNMSSGLGVAYNNVKFSFQNTQSGAAGARELLQMVLQGVFAGLNRDPIMFGWNFGNSDAFVKVIYEELMQSLAFFQRGVRKIIERGHYLNLALRGLSDCKVSATFHAARSLDQFRDSEAEYMDSKKILDQLESLVISPEEARKNLGYDMTPTKVGSFVATFEKSENRYLLQAKGSHIFPVNNASSFEPQSDYDKEIKKILTKANNDGLAAFAMWLSLQGGAPLADVLKEGLETYLYNAEKSISEKDVELYATENVSKLWEEGQTDPRLFSGVEENLKKDKKTDLEIAAMVYLSTIVDPYMVKNFLSRSDWRVERLRKQLESLYNEYGVEIGSPERLNAFKAAVGSFMGNVVNEAASSIGDVTTQRAKAWGALYALKNSNVTKFMVVGPDDDRKCEFCRSMLGKVFSVDTEIRNIEDVVAKGNPNIADDIEFLMSQYPGKEGAARLNEMDGPEVQENGFAVPPYHVNCRDSIVAVS